MSGYYYSNQYDVPYVEPWQKWQREAAEESARDRAQSTDQWQWQRARQTPLRFQIRGVTFCNRQSIVHELQPQDGLLIHHEPGNPADRFAVAIRTMSNFQKLGYVPREMKHHFQDGLYMGVVAKIKGLQCNPDIKGVTVQVIDWDEQDYNPYDLAQWEDVEQWEYREYDNYDYDADEGAAAAAAAAAADYEGADDNEEEEEEEEGDDDNYEGNYDGDEGAADADAEYEGDDDGGDADAAAQQNARDWARFAATSQWQWQRVTQTPSRFQIRGVTMQGRQNIVDELEGTTDLPVLICYEPGNPYDLYAVAIRTLNGFEKVGYVPREMTQYFQDGLYLGVVENVMEVPSNPYIKGVTVQVIGKTDEAPDNLAGWEYRAFE